MNEILELYKQFYLYDIKIFTNIWIYIPLLIPILFYIQFFALKWCILTLPIWLPLVIVLRGIKR